MYILGIQAPLYKLVSPKIKSNQYNQYTAHTYLYNSSALAGLMHMNDYHILKDFNEKRDSLQQPIKKSSLEPSQYFHYDATIPLILYL